MCAATRFSAMALALLCSILAAVFAPAAAAADYVPVTGRVETADGTPLCAMLLANGQHSFTCSGDGSFSLNVPPAGDATVTLMAFCDGMESRTDVLGAQQASDLRVVMSSAVSTVTPEVTARLTGLPEQNRVNVSGTVSLHGQPLCAMALANGVHAFTCAGDGRFSLDVPIGSAQQVVLFAFVSGMAPFRRIFGEGELPPGTVLPTGGIQNIDEFLDKCPTADPEYARFVNDFTIRRNGRVVRDFPCAEPVQEMVYPQADEALRALQTLRTIYYMDKGRSGHLPWTEGTLYDWFKAKIGGIDIRDDTTDSWCCETIDGRPHIVTVADDQQESAFPFRYRFLGWLGISGRISLWLHEARHVDGYPHVDCCGTGYCDQTYDESDLSSIAMQWWIEAAWLSGHINVGLACLEATPDYPVPIEEYHRSAANNLHRLPYCDNKPPFLPMPAQPGGACTEDAGEN